MPNITDRASWIKARKRLLMAEKAHLKARDALAADRRALPWVKLDQPYQFVTEAGEKSLSELFGGHSQLVIYHFMYGTDWDAGCQSCSLWADGFNGITPHLAARDTAFLAVSTASLSTLTAFKSRMGWNFNWVSCENSSFNRDFHAAFLAEDLAANTTTYNYKPNGFNGPEAPAISCFTRQGDDIFHTYSCYARGLDNVNTAYQFLDLTAKGRDEDGLDWPMAWVKRHDEYETS